jgi:hypothetical protein
MGNAYASIGRPFDASGVYENLLADLREARPADDPLARQVGAIADAAYRALEAEHGPIPDGR